MKKNNHELLAEVLVDEVMRIDGEGQYIETYNCFTRIADATICASERSSLEADLKRFLKTEDGKYLYSEEDVNDFVVELSEKIGKKEKIRFQTKALFESLTSKLIAKLQKYGDPWETAKLIFVLGSLYSNHYTDKEIMEFVIASIKDEKQKRMVAICGRIYAKGYDDVIEFFRPGIDV